MLELVSIFLATFIVAAVVIRVHRVFFGVQNYDSKAIAKKRGGGSTKLGAQQSHVSRGSKATKASRKVKAKPGLRVTGGSNKVPWGW